MLVSETDTNISPQPDLVSVIQHKKMILPCTHSPMAARFIAIAYAIFGLVWLLISNLLPVDTHIYLHHVSGSTFILLTAALLYLLVRRYTADISCTNDLFNQLFEASPNAIAVIRDQDQKILLVNK